VLEFFLSEMQQGSELLGSGFVEAVLMVTAAEHGFPRHTALASILKGCALAMQGQGDEGIAQIRQGLVAYRKLGIAMEDPYLIPNRLDILID
jgi:hypothetical protein